MRGETMRERLIAAHEGVAQAEEHRSQVIAQARDIGIPLRTIGTVLGVAASTAMHWSGGARDSGGEDLLDAPAPAPDEQGGPDA